MPQSPLRKALNEFLIKLESGRGGYNFAWEGRRLLVHPYDRRFWSRVASGSWEPGTLRWMKQRIRPGDLFLDVGAWIGPTAVYAASLGARVVAFEPDPFAYERLLFNLNKNSFPSVSSLHGALGLELGTLPLSSPRGLGKSFSRLGARGEDSGTAAVQVPVFDWATVARLFAFDRADIVKIDIEGGEFDLFPALAEVLLEKSRAVVVSLHGPSLKAGEFSAKIGALRLATERFSRRSHLDGRPWQWSEQQEKSVATSYTEIVLEP